MDRLLARGKVVASVDVLIGMGLLEPKRLENWRRGRVSYLENAYSRHFVWPGKGPLHFSASKKGSASGTETGQGVEHDLAKESDE